MGAVEGDWTLTTIKIDHEVASQKLLQATETVDWTSVDLKSTQSAIESVRQEDRDTSKDTYVHFYNSNEKYGHVHALPGYFSSVARTHATYESAMAYVKQPDHRARNTPKPTLWLTPFCSSELMEAIMAYRTIFDPPP